MTAPSRTETPPPSPAPDGSALCLTCGLCCTGTIFIHVTLGEDELAAARRLRLPLVQRADHMSFRQPCPAHHELACSIYDERPRACRVFHCHTLEAYVAGEIDRGAADERIGRLRAASGRVAASLPGDSAKELGVWAAAERFAEELERAPDPASLRSQHAALLFDLLELARLCHRDFHDPPKRA